MKTRPIHHSVIKRAKQATSKVKSIVEWIKTGRKNNREVLESVDQIYKDQFRHKEHQKHGRKQKERTVQYVSQ